MRQTLAAALGSIIGVIGIRHLWRKNYIFRKNLTARKVVNIALRSLAFICKLPKLGGVPVHLKVDVSPQCQLRCPVCLQSEMSKAERQTLPKNMALATFTNLVDQVRGRTHVMSLYNLGEPLMNKDLPSMIEYASKANINTYITSNFSFPFNEERLTRIIKSGLTLLIVAVDGISDATFGKQRIGGRWDLIEKNLRQFISLRGTHGPRIALQYIVFDHNRFEVDSVKAYCDRLGIDDLILVQGETTPWATLFAERAEWLPKPKTRLPRCAWPFFSAVIAPNGNVFGCCNYRMEENYLRQQDVRPMGNINTTKMAEIYSSEAYQAARRLTIDPARHGPLTGHFCDGCPAIQGGWPVVSRKSLAASQPA